MEGAQEKSHGRVVMMLRGGTSLLCRLRLIDGEV